MDAIIKNRNQFKKVPQKDKPTADRSTYRNTASSFSQRMLLRNYYLLKGEHDSAWNEPYNLCLKHARTSKERLKDTLIKEEKDKADYKENGVYSNNLWSSKWSNLGENKIAEKLYWIYMKTQFSDTIFPDIS